MLNQPSNITPDELNGTGTVDVTDGIAVSWQVSGDSAMTDYKIDIYENDSESTLVYSTGQVTLVDPFWGTTYSGEVLFFSVTLSAADLTTAGMSNGNEYKLLITQWWDVSDSVQQTTASLFITRATPTLTITSIPSPVTAKEYSFTATYSQAQGDPIKWVRWQIAYADDTDHPFLDTGNIYGTGELQVDYDGFLTDTSYSIRCTIETSTGVDVTTGWTDFAVEYILPAAAGTAKACVVLGDSCVWVSWDRDISADGYSVMRQTVGENRLIKIADVESTAGQLRDYSARSGNTYIYYVFPEGSLAYLTQPMVTEPLPVQYWFWSIIEAEPMSAANSYSVIASHIFRYGAGGVSEGSFSNNNSPSIQQNFTRYPTRQGVASNYLTGSVSGYIGTINRNTIEYSDTIAKSEAIFNLSNSENALFLADPKGHFLRIHTASATTLTIDHKKANMPQTMSFNWVEVGTTDGVHTIMYSGGDFYPVDRVIFTRFSINPNTGSLMWEVPDNYSGTGSILTLSAGNLLQNDDGPFNPATMAIDYTDGTVSATVGA